MPSFPCDSFHPHSIVDAYHKYLPAAVQQRRLFDESGFAVQETRIQCRYLALFLLSIIFGQLVLLIPHYVSSCIYNSNDEQHVLNIVEATFLQSLFVWLLLLLFYNNNNSYKNNPNYNCYNCVNTSTKFRYLIFFISFFINCAVSSCFLIIITHKYKSLFFKSFMNATRLCQVFNCSYFRLYQLLSQVAIPCFFTIVTAMITHGIIFTQFTQMCLCFCSPSNSSTLPGKYKDRSDLNTPLFGGTSLLNQDLMVSMQVSKSDRRDSIKSPHAVRAPESVKTSKTSKDNKNDAKNAVNPEHGVKWDESHLLRSTPVVSHGNHKVPVMRRDDVNNASHETGTTYGASGATTTTLDDGDESSLFTYQIRAQLVPLGSETPKMSDFAGRSTAHTMTSQGGLSGVSTVTTPKTLYTARSTTSTTLPKVTLDAGTAGANDMNVIHGIHGTHGINGMTPETRELMGKDGNEANPQYLGVRPVSSAKFANMDDIGSYGDLSGISDTDGARMNYFERLPTQRSDMESSSDSDGSDLGSQFGPPLRGSFALTSGTPRKQTASKSAQIRKFSQQGKQKHPLASDYEPFEAEVEKVRKQGKKEISQKFKYHNGNLFWWQQLYWLYVSFYILTLYVVNSLKFGTRGNKYEMFYYYLVFWLFNAVHKYFSTRIARKMDQIRCYLHATAHIRYIINRASRIHGRPPNAANASINASGASRSDADGIEARLATPDMPTFMQDRSNVVSPRQTSGRNTPVLGTNVCRVADGKSVLNLDEAGVRAIEKLWDSGNAFASSNNEFVDLNSYLNVEFSVEWMNEFLFECFYFYYFRLFVMSQTLDSFDYYSICATHFAVNFVWDGVRMSKIYYDACNWVVNTVATQCMERDCCTTYCSACSNERNLREFLSKVYDNCEYYEWQVRMSLTVVPKMFISFLSYSSVLVAVICINLNKIDSNVYATDESYMFVLIGASVLFGCEMFWVLMVTLFHLKWHELNIFKPFQGLFDVHIYWIAVYWIVIASFVFSIASYQF